MEAVRKFREPTPEPTPELDAAAQLRVAREVLRLEAVGLWKVSTYLDKSFSSAIDLVRRAKGSVIVTGMGKAGLVGQKIAATLASTGTPSHFLHPAEAFHGDLGRIASGDVVLMLTQSGETSEVVQLLRSLHEMDAPLVAMTACRTSSVGRAATVVIELGELEEACSLGLAPSTSTTAMLAVGDALAVVLSRLQGFGAEDFARFHPGGSLGFKLSKVEDHMRSLAECRVASDANTVREVIVACSQPGRRTGAVMLIDKVGELSGVFTDSDLARLVEGRQEVALDRPIGEVMTTACARVIVGARTEIAIEILSERKISELPVVDMKGHPVGMIDVTDVVGTPARQSAAEDSSPDIRV
ncbi:MAG: KpsF/GutQ family sugar-phosphate isomerase, partial [Aeoliella sp.]